MRRFIVVLALGLLTTPLAADAQQPRKVPRIGYLSGGSPPASLAFWQGMRDLGYVEGENVAVEYRWAHGSLQRLPRLAAELVSLKVDVIVAPDTSAALAAQKATTIIPIVMVIVGDPGAFTASLARPRGNITGLSFFGPELGAKQLELLKAAVPKVSRVVVLWHVAHEWPLLWQEMHAAARSLTVKSFRGWEVRGPDDLEGAFAETTKEGTDAIIVLPDVLFLVHRKRLVELAAKHRLPTMHGFRESVEAGGLMAYGPNLSDILRRAASYVDKILKGARPADLPVEQPMRFELVVNLKTAKALGLTIPQSVLIRADEVIR